MKPIFKPAGLFLFLAATLTLSAQVGQPTRKDSTGRKTQPVNLGSVSFLINSGSNGMNQYMLNRLGLGGYISGERIDAAEKIIKDNNRTGIFMMSEISASLRAKPDTAARGRWRLKPGYVSISRSSALGLLYTGDAFRLVFQGNAPYLGRKLNLGGSGMQQFSANAVMVRFDDVYRNSANGQYTTLGFSVGLGQLTAYRKLRLKEGWLYTDSNRNYIEAQYDGTFFNAGKSNAAGVGYGLNTDIVLRWGKVRTHYYIHVANLGLYYIPEGIRMEKHMKEPVRIDQAEISLKALNTDSWLEDLRDTVNGGLAPDSTGKSAFVVSPFMVVWRLMTPKVHLGLDYLAITGYVPRISVSPARGIWNYRRFRLSPEFQLGGFDNYNFNLGLTYHLSRNDGETARKRVGFNLKFQGLEGWILPGKDHGAGLIFNAYLALW